MAYGAKVYRVLIASPGDVLEARQAVREVLQEWNDHNSDEYKVVLLPVAWDTHASPDLSERPQSVINKQMVDQCDVLVGVFWTRLGTPTGEAESGTVEEIRRFLSRGKKVMLYFSIEPVSMLSVDQGQYQRLKDFEKECRDKGLVWTFDTTSYLRTQLDRHLTDFVRRSRIPGTASPDSGGMKETASHSGQRDLAGFLNRYKQLLQEFTIDWTAERDSHPRNLDGGKAILRRTDQALVRMGTDPVLQEHPEFNQTLTNLLPSFRTLESWRLYGDGGTSYRAFWQSGDKLIELMMEFAGQLRTGRDVPLTNAAQ